MVERQRALPGLRLGDGDAGRFDEAAKRVRAPRCRCTPPPATMQRLLRGCSDDGRRASAGASHPAAAAGWSTRASRTARSGSRTPPPERPAARPASPPRCRPATSARASLRAATGSSCSGPVDAIPVARHRLEAVVHRHVARLRPIRAAAGQEPAAGWRRCRRAGAAPAAG